MQNGDEDEGHGEAAVERKRAQVIQPPAPDLQRAAQRRGECYVVFLNEGSIPKKEGGVVVLILSPAEGASRAALNVGNWKVIARLGFH